jgi:hypothetical protein
MRPHVSRVPSIPPAGTQTGSGSAASNITCSRPSSETIRETTSVLHSRTCSVMPSDSIITIVAPASRCCRASSIAWPTSRLPSAFARSDRARPARSELDADPGLRFETARNHRPGQSDQVLRGQRDEPARDLEDVEAELRALAETAIDRVRAPREHVFEEVARRDLDAVCVTELVQSSASREPNGGPPGYRSAGHRWSPGCGRGG